MLHTGNQLKAARALAGISQAELAKAAGVKSRIVSSREKPLRIPDIKQMLLEMKDHA